MLNTNHKVAFLCSLKISGTFNLSSCQISYLIMGLPYIWDQIFSFSFEGLDEGDPKGNYAFLFILHAFYLMVMSDSNTDVNALNVLLLVC